MLGRHVSRVAAPLVARQSATSALPRLTSGVPLKGSVPRSPLSTRAAVRAAPVPPTFTASHASTHGPSSSSSSSSTDASSPPSPVALSAAALAAVGVVGALLLAHSAEGEEAQWMAEVREEIRAFGSKFGLSAAQCDAAAADTPVHTLPPMARVPVSTFALPPVPLAPVVDEPELASYVRRIISYFLDLMVVHVLMTGTAVLASVAVPSARLHEDGSRYMAATFLIAVLYQFTALLGFNGKTVGKWVCGLRTRRIDLGDMDSKTAGILAGCMGFNVVGGGGVPGIIALAAESCREKRQLTHNWLSQTIVVRDTKLKAVEEEEEEEETDA